jgi:hypothetical protein
MLRLPSSVTFSQRISHPPITAPNKQIVIVNRQEQLLCRLSALVLVAWICITMLVIALIENLDLDSSRSLINGKQPRGSSKVSSRINTEFYYTSRTNPVIGQTLTICVTDNFNEIVKEGCKFILTGSSKSPFDSFDHARILPSVIASETSTISQSQDC